MYGAETSSLSSTIAKCWERLDADRRRSELSWPRWAILRVMSWNALRPLLGEVEGDDRLVADCWSKLCSGFLMSVPESAGRSRTTHQRSGAAAVRARPSGRAGRATPAGTSTISAFAFCGGRQRVLGRLARCRTSARSRTACAWSCRTRRSAAWRRLRRRRRTSFAGSVGPLGRRRRRALRRLLDRLVEPAIGCRVLAVDVRVRLALRVEEVGLPVVEEQLGGRADLLGGALGVLDARQVDLDLVGAGLVDLRLGDAELR